MSGCIPLQCQSLRTGSLFEDAVWLSDSSRTPAPSESCYTWRFHHWLDTTTGFGTSHTLCTRIVGSATLAYKPAAYNYMQLTPADTKQYSLTSQIYWRAWLEYIERNVILLPEFCSNETSHIRYICNACKHGHVCACNHWLTYKHCCIREWENSFGAFKLL